MGSQSVATFLASSYVPIIIGQTNDWGSF